MKYIFLAMLGCFACSCATVVRGTSETAKFESTPTGANVVAESVSEDKQGPYYCVTPCKLELKRKRTWKVDFSLEGYKPVSGLLKPVVTGGGVAAGAGNVLLGGLIGVGIDAGTGANMDLRPNPMVAQLQPIDSPEPSLILDAELIAGDEADDAEVMEAPEAVDADSSSEPDTDSTEMMDEPAPAEEPAADEGDSESIEEAAPIAGGKNVNFEPENAEMQPVEISNSSPVGTETAPVKHYKPGEVAPHDEEADDLNAMQLKRALTEPN